MHRVWPGLAMLALAVFSVSLDAQQGPAMAPGGPGAEFFLARTGDLRLTDAQVVRLAAIARRSAERRRAMRATMDSLAPARRGLRADSADRAARAREIERIRSRFERDREQARADLRDALAVLTPDQQAMAWEMRARGGTSARGARDGRFRRERRPGMERRQRSPGELRRPDPGQPPPGQRSPQ
jgi:Spy/CpxP family protein refolding chaperone